MIGGNIIVRFTASEAMTSRGNAGGTCSRFSKRGRRSSASRGSIPNRSVLDAPSGCASSRGKARSSVQQRKERLGSCAASEPGIYQVSIYDQSTLDISLRMTRRDKSDLLHGSLDLIVLRTLSAQSMHGYAITQHVVRLTDGVLTAEPGALYPALERLKRQGFVTGHWKTSPTGRRARYYTITRSGLRQLRVETDGFERFVGAMRRVLRAV
jgi:PadR family transcriptional regulator